MQPEQQSSTAQRGLGVGQLQRILTLRTFPGLAATPAEDLAAMAQHMLERQYAAGERLLHDGQPVTRMFFIVDGEVELRRGGREHRTLGSKAVIGGLPAMARDADGYDALAVRDTLALVIPFDDMMDIFEDNFAILRRVLAGMCREALEARRRLSAAGFSNVIAEPLVEHERPLDLVERMTVLRSVMSFTQSRLEAIAEMAHESRELRHAAGETLWKEGDTSDSMLVVVRGVVECKNADSGSFRFGPGDTLGSLETPAGIPRWYDAVVAEDLIALALDREVMFDVFEDQFDMAMDMLEGLARTILSMYDVRS